MKHSGDLAAIRACGAGPVAVGAPPGTVCALPGDPSRKRAGRSLLASALTLLAFASPAHVRSQVAAGDEPAELALEHLATLGADDFCCLSVNSHVGRFSDGRYIAGPTFDPGEFVIFDPDGSFLARFGGEGEGPGEFQQIRGVRVLEGDSIAIWGTPERISIHASDGNYTRAIPLRSVVGVTDLVERPDGSFAVSGSIVAGEGLGANAIAVMSRRGEVLEASSLPRYPWYRLGIAQDGGVWFGVSGGGSDLFRLDPNSDRIVEHRTWTWPWAGDDPGRGWGVGAGDGDALWIAGARRVRQENTAQSGADAGAEVAVPPQREMESVEYWYEGLGLRPFAAVVGPNGATQAIHWFERSLPMAGWIAAGIIAVHRESEDGELVIDVMRLVPVVSGREAPN